MFSQHINQNPIYDKFSKTIDGYIQICIRKYQEDTNTIVQPQLINIFYENIVEEMYKTSEPFHHYVNKLQGRYNGEDELPINAAKFFRERTTYVDVGETRTPIADDGVEDDYDDAEEDIEEEDYSVIDNELEEEIKKYSENKKQEKTREKLEKELEKMEKKKNKQMSDEEKERNTDLEKFKKESEDEMAKLLKSQYKLKVESEIKKLVETYYDSFANFIEKYLKMDDANFGKKENIEFVDLVTIDFDKIDNINVVMSDVVSKKNNFLNNITDSAYRDVVNILCNDMENIYKELFATKSDRQIGEIDKKSMLKNIVNVCEINGDKLKEYRKIIDKKMDLNLKLNSFDKNFAECVGDEYVKKVADYVKKWTIPLNLNAPPFAPKQPHVTTTTTTTTITNKISNQQQPTDKPIGTSTTTASSNLSTNTTAAANNSSIPSTTTGTAKTANQQQSPPISSTTETYNQPPSGHQTGTTNKTSTIQPTRDTKGNQSIPSSLSVGNESAITPTEAKESQKSINQSTSISRIAPTDQSANATEKQVQQNTLKQSANQPSATTTPTTQTTQTTQTKASSQPPYHSFDTNTSNQFNTTTNNQPIIPSETVISNNEQNTLSTIIPTGTTETQQPITSSTKTASSPQTNATQQQAISNSSTTNSTGEKKTPTFASAFNRPAKQINTVAINKPQSQPGTSTGEQISTIPTTTANELSLDDKLKKLEEDMRLEQLAADKAVELENKLRHLNAKKLESPSDSDDEFGGEFDGGGANNIYKRYLKYRKIISS